MKEVASKRDRAEVDSVTCMSTDFVACRQTFVGELHKEGGFGSAHGRSTQVKQADGARKPGRWSRKAGGHYSQCSFCMKLSVHEKGVDGSRWSLFTVVT